jgi:putative cell wall-binding protein
MPSLLRRTTATTLALAVVATLLTLVVTQQEARGADSDIRITEWAYNGSEFFELTNVGTEAVDVTGWSYDDSHRVPGTLSLAPFGKIGAGESVLVSEASASAFRTTWGLCDGVRIIGSNTENLGSGDEINIYHGSTLVDRLTYTNTTPVTNDSSAWVTAAGLGTNSQSLWTKSTSADAEASYAATGLTNFYGSPGKSTQATIPFDPCKPIRLTEFQYNGDVEWFELTNVGHVPVDMAGWTFDDVDRNPATGGLDLTSLGTVQPGESVVVTDLSAGAFRTYFSLCAGVKVVGGSTQGLGRSDEINVYDSTDGLVDRLTFNDQGSAPVNAPRTDVKSAWVGAAAVGRNLANQWTLSTVGDAEGSAAGTGTSVGSPGRSTMAVVSFDPCAVGSDPTVTSDSSAWVGAVGDPTNPTLDLTIADADSAVADVTLTATSANTTVLPDSGIAITGTGATRTVTFTPAARGTSSVTFTATDPDDNTGTLTIGYGASGQADGTGRYFHGISDASTAIDVGDGYVLLANDESNEIFLHRTGVSGPPVRTWPIANADLGISGGEVDIEGAARTGNTILWTGSLGNNREGEPKPERRTIFTTTISGSGASTQLTFGNDFHDLWAQLLAWDHGRSDALGLTAAAADGVLPNPPDGLNVEGFEFAPDGTTGLFGFRAPTIGAAHQALVVPVTNVLDLPAGTSSTAAFGSPILLDLGGRSVREIRCNAAGEYLIVAGATPQASTWALYRWDGVSTTATFLRQLPDEDLLTGGAWEALASMPDHLTADAEVRLVADSGDVDFYGTGPTKDLDGGYQKSYSVVVTAVPAPTVVVPVPAAPSTTQPVTAPAGGGDATVQVRTSAGTVAVVLRNATGGGSVEVTTGGAPPASADGGLTLLGPTFDITPTGLTFNGAEVCVPYDRDAVARAGIDPSAVALFHFDRSGRRQDITGRVDVVAGVICGTTPSFSMFAVGSLATQREAGADRYATAAALSAATFPPGVAVAYVASGADHADALAGGPAAAADGAPLLLVEPDRVPAVVAAELARLAPTRVVVLGGPEAVSDAVVRTLGATRISGADRYTTAAAISAATFDPGVPVAYLATGREFADALAGGAAAAVAGGPVLLTGRDALPSPTATELARLRPKRLVVLGGTAAVADAALAQASAAAKVAATRVAGADRYATAAAVVAAAFPSTGGTVFVASGASFADALAAVAAAARSGSPLLLVGADVPTGAATQLARLAPKGIVVVGGDAAIGRQVESDVAGYLP